MIILGIDPGTATTGYGVIKKTPRGKKLKNGFAFEYLIHGVIKTTTDKTAAERLNKIHIELTKILKKHQPSVMAVESLYFFKNLKTALTGQPSQRRYSDGCRTKTPAHPRIYALADENDCCRPWPGRKKDVQEMIKKILSLDEIPRPDDAADALGIAICCGLKITNATLPGQKKKKSVNKS